ncbi:hypothetical protein MTO96_002685 [Rhipicephalus appendiculatus]
MRCTASFLEEERKSRYLFCQPFVSEIAAGLSQIGFASELPRLREHSTREGRPNGQKGSRDRRRPAHQGLGIS